ncbi:MAG: ABC transporter permease, partial [Bacteroidota bacterium]|nr:ABC transporter permease [Bacteroidota bacterium]
AIGRVLQMKINDRQESFTVSGVAENAPQNSTIKFGIILPFDYYKQHIGRMVNSWAGGSATTFLLLSPGADISSVEKKIQKIFDENAKAEIAEGEKMMGSKMTIVLHLQPLTDIHLDTKAGISNGLADGSSTTYSYLLSCIAVFILIVACINFINLAIAQSLKRSKEIGIRKVVGSSRGQLIRQFLVESVVVSSIAFVLAIGLTLLLLPYFNQLANKKLSLSYLSDGYLYAAYFLLLILTSIMAGLYPSVVLARFQPVKVLYRKAKWADKNYFTKGLIVVQFALAVFLVIGTLTVYAQLGFLLHKDLGFDAKNLLVINIPRSKTNNDLLQLFRNELAGESSIVNIAPKNGGNSRMPVKIEDKQIFIDYNKVDHHFFPTFKIPLLAGRNFSPDFSTDSVQAAVVNESFIREAGWKTGEAIGKSIRFLEGPKKLTIIGVIKDYHFASLKEKLIPQLFTMDTGMQYGQIWVRIKPDKVSYTLALLEHTFKKLAPLYPYDYQFMDSINARNYEEEAKWKQIIAIAAGLFIFVSCIGLFGLVLLSIEQRTKEIGIRKVLGAAVSSIVMLISKEFVRLIGIAFLIAVPAGYYAVNKWLEDFPYRIAVNWWLFAAAGLLVVFFALMTLTFQTVKAARANPVKNLRTE